MQMPSDALGVAYELPGAPRDLRKLGGADHQEGDNSDDQPMQRRERTVKRHTHRLPRPDQSAPPIHLSSSVNFESTDCAFSCASRYPIRFHDAPFAPRGGSAHARLR